MIAYLTGNNATDSIKVDFSKLDTNQVRRVKVYNKNVKDAYPFYNTTLLSALSIPPGLGRTYELKDKQWVLASGASALLDKDPYIDELPFGTTSYGVEKYAKGVGMVYQELLLWEHQPNPGGTPYKEGFGVKRTMNDHN